MEYKNFTVKDTRGDPMHSFVIGPTMSLPFLEVRALTFQRYLVAPMTHRRVQVFADLLVLTRSRHRARRQRRQFRRVTVIYIF